MAGATCARWKCGTATWPRRARSCSPARLDLIDDLAPLVAANYAGVAPGVAAGLRSGTGRRSGTRCRNGERADVAELEEALLAEIARVRPQEVERGVCLVGPHRDELELTLGDSPAKGYASHGESWSFALALRLGAYDLLRDDGAEPVLVLDDVFAELDRRRRQQLAKVAANAEQVMVTAAVAEDVPEELAGARYEVRDGEVNRVR